MIGLGMGIWELGLGPVPVRFSAKKRTLPPIPNSLLLRLQLVLHRSQSNSHQR
jgi:hypothetical protein